VTVTSVSPTAAAANASSEQSTPQRVNGGYALMDALRRHGVEHIFGYPGGAILPIYDELHKAESRGWLKHILVRHEQGGTHAADAYARDHRQGGRVLRHLRPRRHQLGDRHRHRPHGLGARWW